MSSNRHRDKRICIWVVNEEKAMAELKANESDMSLSDYIRSLILFGSVRGSTVNFSKENTEKIIYELNRIGNNINQIAYRVNSNATVDENDFDSLREQFIEYLGLFQDVVKDR